jgi:crotonobetaine/carnitine-CoA ligase
MENCPEFLQAWFACALLGAVAVSTNTRSARDEMAYFTEHSGAVAAMTQPRYAALVGAAMPGAAWIAVTATDAGEAPAAGTAPSAGDSFEALFADEQWGGGAGVSPWAPASIQYTSGTTSRPKAVVWTHANALWGARVSATHETLRPDDRHLVYLPLYHTNAQSYSVLATLWAGASMVLQPRFSARRFWDVSRKHRCTWTSLVPFCTKALAQYDVPEHSYRLWGNGISMPPSDDRYGVVTIGWWGMTETVTHGIVDDVVTPGRPLTCGRPAPEYDVRVTRPDGTPVEPGETGDLFVRGVRGLSLFAEYLHDEAATRAAVDDDGWLTTGDRVTVNDDGSISFADRDKDMLKVGGENVAASEIEAVVLRVDGVGEVAVVAGPHPMLDEVPVCFIIPRDDREGLADDVLAACREKLADFKVPREVRLVDSLPRSTLEKIAKAELRAQLREGAESGRA